LRGLQTELGDSSNAIRVELNRFEKSGLLQSFSKGNKKFFKANTAHPLYKDIHSIMLKHIGVDKIISSILEKLGYLEEAYLLGSFSKGIDSPFIDVLIIGQIDKAYLVELIEKAEVLINRKIRYLVYKSKDLVNWSEFGSEPLLIWEEAI